MNDVKDEKKDFDITDLVLREAINEQEKIFTFENNFESWGKNISKEEYIQSEIALFESDYALSTSKVMILVEKQFSKCPITNLDQIYGQLELYVRSILENHPTTGLQEKKIWSISGFLVSASKRGLGLGNILASRLFDYLKAKQVEYVNLYSDIGEKFYKSISVYPYPVIPLEYKLTSNPEKANMFSSISEIIHHHLPRAELIQEDSLFFYLEDFAMKEILDTFQHASPAQLSLAIVPTVENIKWHWIRPMLDRPALFSDPPIFGFKTADFGILYKVGFRVNTLYILQSTIDLRRGAAHNYMPIILRLLKDIARFYELGTILFLFTAKENSLNHASLVDEGFLPVQGHYTIPCLGIYRYDKDEKYIKKFSSAFTEEQIANLNWLNCEYSFWC